MPLSIADLSPTSITTSTDHPVVRFAGEELAEHLRSAPAAGSGIEVVLEAGTLDSDGFEVAVEGESVTIAGDSPRGTLNGAYWLLERLGFLWVRPGETGRRFVLGRTLAEGRYRETPGFPRRTLILGNDALHDEWPEWLEFASRNRYNSVFFHDTPPSVIDRGKAHRPLSAEDIARDGKGWMFERWDSDGEAIRAEAAKRGIALQFGGHHLPGLLKRELFASHPDWFPLRNGARDARYNLCVSSPDAIAEVSARAREFLQRFHGAAVYHLWADDIVGGGWCSCDDCAALTPSDQALRATNVLAGVLAGIDAAARIAHLAYHDTIAPPKSVTPASNVTALYAPRNRNYAFPIDDPSCPRNVDGHYAELLGLDETFRDRPNALACFEYYSDAILYKWLDPPNLQVLPCDARAYARAGTFDFGNLAVTPRPWVGPTWHAWWFARCAWNPDVDARAELEHFCAATYDSDAAKFADLYTNLDAAYRELLDLGELERIPRHDVLDFSDTPRQALTRKAQQLREAVAAMNAAVADVPLVPAGLGSAAREDLAIQLSYANHLAARVSAWDEAIADNRTAAEEYLASAAFILSAVGDWSRTHTSSAYANLSHGMLRAASWHTEQIAKMVERLA
ncbi:MAG: DUF4838 domain-containing protein [Dehalococcoidia bacterium]